MVMTFGHISFILIFVHSLFNFLLLIACDRAKLNLQLLPYVFPGIRTFLTSTFMTLFPPNLIILFAGQQKEENTL